MTPERWQRLADLFESAIDREPAARAAYLAAACADDPALRHEVEALLRSHEHAGDFGSAPAFQFVAAGGSARGSAVTARTAALALGSRLGRYEIISLLGAGGMGEVYRAYDPQLGREVGIKILLGRGAITSDQLERFEREARAAGALNHSNILTVFDIGVERDVPYVVSELLHGETLRARLRAGALPVEQALEIALQIVSGLTAAHDKGIVHRDVKPENLFITADGLVKILDFGLAKQTAGVSVDGDDRAERWPGRDEDPGAAHRPAQEAERSLTGHGFLIGTAGYMSPEHVLGQAGDARADIFAFGAVLYEMLNGRRAFVGVSPAETMQTTLTHEPPFPEAVPLPATLTALVRQCLAKDPDRRFQSARVLETALATVRESLITTAPPSGLPWSGRADGSARRASSMVRWGAAAIALCAVVVATVALSSGSWRGSPRPGASGRPALAVMPLEDHSGDPQVAWLASGVQRMLVTSLAQTPGVDVIGSERLDAAFRELGRTSSDASARTVAARRAGAGAVLAGSLFRAGSDIRIDMQVEDVETGRILAATSEQGRDVFALVDALTNRIRAALDVKDRPAGRPLRDVTTSSLAAYELYVKGLDAWHNRRWADARTIFEEAVRIDPEFAQAHAQLAILLERLGERGRAGEQRQHVMRLLDRLPERQRLLAEAKHASEIDLPRARLLLERLIERYPDEEEAYDVMVHTYTFTRDPVHWKETLAFMQRWERAIPGPGSGHFHNHYGYALVDHRLFTEAEREFRAYARVSPDEANPYDSLGELFLVTGRPAEAIAHFDQALARNPLFGNSYFGRAYGHAMRGQYDAALASLSQLEELGPRAGLPLPSIHLNNAFFRTRVGQYREADRHITRAIRVARDTGDTTAERGAHLFEALLALERGDRPAVLAAAGEMESIPLAPSAGSIGARQSALARLIVGTLEASRGRVEAARAHLAAQRKLDAGSDEIQLAWRQALTGEVALASGELTAADAAFRSTEYKIASFSIYPDLVTLVNHLPFRDGLARVQSARGNLLDAVQMYRRLNTPDATARWTSVVEPRFVLAAARLAARAGDRAMAFAEYARFLELWKDADAGLPELAEARRYLNGAATSERGATCVRCTRQ